MTTKLDETYARICEQERELEEKLRVVRVQRATLEMAGANRNGSLTQEPNGHHGRVEIPMEASNRLESQGRASGRAPQGELRSRILAVLRDRGPSNNKELRDALVAQGYRWSLDPVHVSKMLTKLRRAKEVKSDGPDNNPKYRLP